MTKILKKILPYIAIVLAIVLAIPVAIKIFFDDKMPLWVAIICHVLSTIIFTTAFYFMTEDHKREGRIKEKRSNVWWILVMVQTAALPIFGIIMSLVTYSVHKMKKTLPPPIVSDEITVQSPEVFTKKRMLAKQLEVLDRLDIEPFVDIFRRGRTELKKSAVKLLGTMRSKKAISTLMMALMDPDIEIRLFAAGVLSKIEDEYAIDIKNKFTNYKKHPKNKKLGMDLVNLYFSYAEIGLLDTIAKTYYYREALNVLDKLPPDLDVIYAKAHSRFTLGEYDKAKENIDFCLEKDEVNPKYRELLWEIFFSKREYTELAQDIEFARKKEIKSINQNVVDYWA